MVDKKLVYVSIFSLLWSFRIFFDKLFLNTGLNPLSFSIQVLILSVILLTGYVSITRIEEFRKIDKNIVKKFVLLGLFMGIQYITNIYGLKLSTSINYGFLIKSTVVFTSLLAFILLKEKMNKNKILLLITFIIGAYLITTSGKTIIPKIGDLLIIATAFCLSSSTIIQKSLTKKISSDIIAWGNRFLL